MYTNSQNEWLPKENRPYWQCFKLTPYYVKADEIIKINYYLVDYSNFITSILIIILTIIIIYNIYFVFKKLNVRLTLEPSPYYFRLCIFFTKN